LANGLTAVTRIPRCALLPGYENFL